MTPGAHLYPQASDTDVLAPMLYEVLPNKSFSGGYSPNIVFRWRPDGVDNAIMDIYTLKRILKRAARPRSAPVHWLSDSEPFSAAEELGALGVFEHDMAKLPYVQENLRMMGRELSVQFAEYTAIRLRQLHRTLQNLIDA